MSLPNSLHSSLKPIRIAAAKSLCLLMTLLFVSVGFGQEVDVKLIGKRLNNMVKKEQLTQPQADAMLATLKKMVAGEGVDSDKPTAAPPKLKPALTPFMDAKAGNANSKLQPEFGPSAEMPFKFVIPKIESYLKKKQDELHENRIKLQVRLKRLENLHVEHSQKKQRLTEDLGKLKQMLSDAESTGSITRNGKEISMSQLQSLAESTMKKLSVLKSKAAQDAAVMMAYQDSLAKLVAEHKLIAEQTESVKARTAELRDMVIANQANGEIKEHQKKTDAFREMLRDLDREIGKEMEKLNQPPRRPLAFPKQKK